MNYALLRKIRIAASIFFFLAVTLLFIDIKNIIPAQFDSYILYFQFVPSFVKFSYAVSFAAIGFLLIILATLLFGRIYCSSICPFGIFQDIIHKLFRKTKLKRFYNFTSNYIILRYSILILTVVVFVSGSVLLLSFLDPFSIFGRIVTSIFNPVIILMNNSAANILEAANYYAFYPVEFKGVELFALSVSLLFLALIIALVYKNGRLFCNTICPVGTFLGLISKVSLYKIKIDENNCRVCGVCDKFCKGGCIDSKSGTVDFDRCVVCFNCVSVCPSSGIVFTKNKKKSSAADTDYEKRNFILNSIGFFISLTGLSYAQQKIIPKKKNTVPILRKNAVSPPGSYSLESFNDNCTACSLCVSSCPTHVLQPSFLEYGFFAMLQPRMHYSKGFCNYDCTICGEVCPTGAILPVKIEEKKLIQLGKAKFVKDNCIVHTEKTECGACSEHCPTKAVKMVPFENLKEPQVEEEICIGCGACEFACPTIPYKAIYVESNPIHLKAEKPKEEKLEEEIQEDFPF